MKKVINNKLYNTETAKEIHCWDNGYFTNDFNYMSETLFQKKTGEFFLYGTGGAMSRYAESSGNSWGAGCTIIPLTIDETKKWLEDHADGDIYESVFGDIPEDDSRILMTIGIANDAAAKIKRAAQEAEMQIGDYITMKCLGNN